jgi:hydroxyacylglutathione hydrolase
MKKINIFSHEKKSDRYYVFTEGYSCLHRFTIGVIVGDEKILVVDSGMGLTGELRTYIESVVGTDKPMICTCTHGAIDHAGAACLFDERYCSSRDTFMFPRIFNNGIRLADLDAFGLSNPEIIAYCKENLHDNETGFRNVDEGHVFELGGVKIEVIAMPGHTPGSLAYFFREEKVCFTGDAINIDEQIPNIYKFYNEPEHRINLTKYLDIEMDSPRLTLKECYSKYSTVVKRFISIVGEDVTLYSGHLSAPLTIQVAKDIAGACEEIGMGLTQYDPPGESIFTYQSNASTGRDLRIHFCGNVDVMYDRNKM